MSLPEPLRRVLVWSSIFVAAAGTLVLLDRVPSSLAGYRGEVAQPYHSLAELEGALGVRLGFPFFFPEALEWPPAVLLARKQPLQVYAEVRERGGPPGATPTLVVRQWIGEGEHFRAAPEIASVGGGTIALRGGREAQWVHGHDAQGRKWYRAHAERGRLVTELSARLDWKDFEQMVESLEP